MRRRTRFAASFVLVVTGTACKSESSRTSNPPGREARTKEQCEALKEGTPCTAGDRCDVDNGCGLNGFECRDGTWKALMTYCNPPGPKDSPPPK